MMTSALAEAMVNLDAHPGLLHIRRYQPTGVTAERWFVVETALNQLWDDFASAQTDRIDCMRATLATVLEFLDAVEAINTEVAGGVAPVLKRFDAAGAAVPKALTDLLAVSASDPLSLTAGEVQRQCADLTELAALQENWTQAIEATTARLDQLRDARARAVQIRTRAERAVVSSLPALPGDCEAELRAELAGLHGKDPVALRDLRRRIDAAIHRLQQDHDHAQGLLDRRDELTGRLKAYEAKAARLRLAEDPDLLSSRRIAAGLLSRRPCDLRAVTRAVADYQALLAEKREVTR